MNRQKISLRWFLVFTIFLGSGIGLSIRSANQKRHANQRLFNNGFTLAYDLSSIDRRWKNPGFGGGLPSSPANEYLDEPKKRLWLSYFGMDELANPIVYAGGRRVRTAGEFIPEIVNADLEPFAYADDIIELELNWTAISDAGLITISKLSRIKRLELSGCKITDQGLKNLAKLGDLEHLSLNSTQITDRGLRELKGLKKLKHLDLNATNVTGSGLEYLVNNSQLKTLKLSASKFRQEHVGQISNFSQLENLYVSHTNLHDLSDAIEKLPSLQRLDVSQSKVGDELIRALKGRKIIDLLIDGTNVSDSVVPLIVELEIESFFTAYDCKISLENRKLIEDSILQRAKTRRRNKNRRD